MLKGSSYAALMDAIANSKIFTRTIGAAEVGVGIFLFQAAYQQPDVMLFFTIFYWQWVRIRCMLGTTTKESFAAIDRFLSPVISKIPVVSSVYNVLAKVLRYAAQVPEPGERPGYNPCSIM